MKSQIIIIILGLVLVSACIDETYSLINNKSFNQQETKELIALLHQFDKTVCEIENIDGRYINECYESFYKRMWNEYHEGPFNIGISTQQQEELLNLLSEELKDDIWYYGTAIIGGELPTDNFDTIKSISLNQKKYYSFLENEASTVNSNTKEYFQKLKTMGDISPSMYADVAYNYAQYDISDDRSKLLFVIHYLTFNQNNLLLKEAYARLDPNWGKK